MRCLFDLSNRIADRHGETNAAHHGKIREIIAHLGDNSIGHSRLPNNFFVSRHLQRLFQR
jgi:hypothetical protein